MLKFVRRVMLLAALITMGVCVAILRGMVPVNAPDSLVLAAGVVAGIIALVILTLEVRRAGYHPAPEEPPVSDKVILPKDPEMENPVRPVMPPGPLVSPQEVLEKTAKAVETAEAFVHKANGRVRISLEMDDDEQDD